MALQSAAGNSKLSSSSRICMNGRGIRRLLPTPVETWKLESPGTTKCVGERGMLPQSL